MKKLVFVLVAVAIFSNCASTEPKGDPNTYIEKTLADVINSNLTPNEAYNKKEWFGGSYDLFFNITSEVYMQIDHNSSSGIILSDGKGNRITTYSYDFNGTYRLSENTDFSSVKLYRIYYTLVETRSFDPHYINHGRKSITIERIEGLLTYDETYRVAQEESQRIIAQEEETRRAEAESAYQALALHYAGFPNREYDDYLKGYWFYSLEDFQYLFPNAREDRSLSRPGKNVRVFEVIPYTSPENLSAERVYSYHFYMGRLYKVIDWFGPLNRQNILIVYGSLEDMYGRFEGPNRWRVPARRYDYFNDYTIINRDMRPGDIQVRLTLIEIEGDPMSSVMVTFFSPLVLDAFPDLP